MKKKQNSKKRTDWNLGTVERGRKQTNLCLIGFGQFRRNLLGEARHWTEAGWWFAARTETWNSGGDWRRLVVRFWSGVY